MDQIIDDLGHQEIEAEASFLEQEQKDVAWIPLQKYAERALTVGDHRH
jgi:hypothetical protein